MKIVHTVSSLNVGGMEQFVVRLAERQISNGLDSSILALSPGPLKETADKARVSVKILNSRSKLLRACNAMLYFKRAQPHIIHAHNPTSLHYAALGKSATGAQLLMTDHGQGNGIGRAIPRRTWEKTDRIVAVSEATARKRTESPQSARYCVIHNGVELSPVVSNRKEIREKLNIREDSVAGIIVARIDGKKGHETLIAATEALDEKAPYLLIVGDGVQRATLEDIAIRSPNSKQIRFLGFRSDIPDLLAASDFFVLPSLTEGLPLSVLEAMAQKLPVIATNVGGIPELVVDGETGILIPPNDPDALANAMERMIRDPAMRRRMGEAGYHRVATEFSFNEMTRKYEALYLSLLGKKGL